MNGSGLGAERRMYPKLRVFFACLLACGLVLPVAAQQGSGPATPTSRIADREKGEGDKIQRRIEWFFSTRRAGTATDADMAALRRLAVEETRAALETQKRQRAFGMIDEVNFWTSMGPSPSNFGGWAFGPVTGRVPALAADFASGTLYVGSASGGLWKSTNDGASWTQLFDSAGTMTVGSVAVDPNDAQTLWVGTGENTQGCSGYFGIGMLRSLDGGATWEARNGNGANTLEDLSSFASIVVDPRDSAHIVTGGRLRGCTSGAGQAGGIYTTNDAGATWTNRMSGTQVYEIRQDPTVQDIFWAATDKGVYKSTDNGVSWVLQTASGLPNGSTGRTELAIAPSDTNVVYVLFASGASGSAEFWRTTDGGASWTEQSSGSNACDGQCWYNMHLSVHNSDPNTVFRGTVRIYRSTDAGVNWTDLSNGWGSSQKVHQDTHFLMMDPNDDNTFWVGSDGGVWKSVDGGDSFINKNGNMNLTQFYAIGDHPFDPNIICGGAQDNSSLARTTSNTWDLQAVTGDGFVCFINNVNPDYNYITSYPSGGYPSVSRSTDGILGSFYSKTKSGSGIISGDRINWVTPYILDPSTPSTLYLGTHRVYKSTNDADSWDWVGPADMTNGSGNILSLDVNRNFGDVVLAGTTDGNIWRSTNAGIDWVDISAGLPARAISDIASDPTNSRRALATVGGFGTAHLWEWNEGGGDWVAIGSGLPNVPANTVVMLTDLEVYVGTDTGIFQSIDGGLTFVPFMNGVPEGLVTMDLKYNQSMNMLTAGTYGRGAWQVTVDPIGPIVLYDSYEQPLVEVDGDGDGNVEPGETWEIRPLLRNVGNEDALFVEARLVTMTPGASVLTPDLQGYGNIAPGASAPSNAAYSFTIDPDFPCGEAVVFDIVDITSSNAPGVYSDQLAAFSITVVDQYEPPIVTTLVDENFDPGNPADWTHEAIDPNLFLCNLTYVDEWQILSKDAEHGNSYHAGNGPGSSYSRANYAWLYHGGKDSSNGPGIDIPADARSASLSIVHWYSTEPDADGGQVVIDALEDDIDTYETLDPDGGYPAGTLNTGKCNGLEGKDAFHGDSGGWITSTFDLTPYRGKKIYLAFVFGSDSGNVAYEGWYIDDIRVESEKQGAPICQATLWPGRVPATTTFAKTIGDDIEATWADSCNGGNLPGQIYSIQGGNLDSLFSSGSYDHDAVGGLCARTSPSTFTSAPGNRYFLVVPNEGGREGGAGTASNGQERPQVSPICGTLREAACP